MSTTASTSTSTATTTAASATTAEPTGVARLAAVARRVARWHPPLMLLAASMAALTAVCTVGLLADSRELVGQPIWAKPLKFAISTAIYSVTLAWIIHLAPRWRRTMWWTGALIAALLLVELVIIVGAVIVGTTSHFNVATPINVALWSVMAGSIATVWVATGLVALVLIRTDLGDPARNLAVRAGLVVGVIGMALAYLMTFPTADQLADFEGIAGAHTVGVPDGGPGLPILGWSTVAGDLRIPHFVGMHALQLLPLAAIALELASRRFALLAPTAVRVRLLRVLVALYLAVLGVLTAQALMGQSIVRPDAIIATVTALVFATAAVAAVVIVRRGAHRPPA